MIKLFCVSFNNAYQNNYGKFCPNHIFIASKKSIKNQRPQK